jgi:carbamate kinase
MAFNDRTAVVAVGGNSLIIDRAHESIPDQSQAAAATAHHIADMVGAGWNVVITHGSGPQVGFILRRSEIALGEVPPVPMDYAAADL